MTQPPDPPARPGLEPAPPAGAPPRARTTAIAGALLVAVPVAIAIVGPFVAPHDPVASLGAPLGGPGTVGPLGSDQLGRDVLSRVLSGGREIIGIAFAAAVVAELFGLLAGVAVAMYGRWSAAAASFLTRMLLAVPSVLLLSVLVAAFARSPVVLLVGGAIVLVPSLVPVVATKTRTLLGQPWLEAAVLAGHSRTTILVRELLPNLAATLAADFATRFLSAVFLVSTAGFLGLGPEPPSPDWGVLISDAEPTMAQQPWPIIAPGALLCCLAIGVTMLSHNVVAGITGTVGRLAAAPAAPGEARRRTPSRRAVPDTGDVARLSGAVIDVRGLAISDAAGRPVLDGIDLAVAPGESVALLGPSGAGKTTLGLALLGRVRPGLWIRDGRVLVGGVDLLRSTRSQRRAVRRDIIHHVPQDALAALTPTLRVAGQLRDALGGRVTRPSSTRGAVARALLATVRLPADREFLRRYPHQLSGGQRQRLALAMALARTPAAIVLDEPTAGLDPATRDAVLSELIQVRAASSAALIVITHDPVTARRLATRVVRLAGGSLEADRADRAPGHSSRDPAARGSARRHRHGGVERRALLRAEGLSIRHPGQPDDCLHDVDLCLVAGACAVLVGPSGAGKTTLTRALTGLHPARTGRIVLDGQPVSLDVRHRPPPARRRIALVTQDPLASLNPARAVGATLRAAARADGSDRRDVAGALLEKVGLPAAYARQRPHTLSGGEQQRVALARALAAHADVLICDEPTASLDPVARDTVCAVLAELRDAHDMALLVATHDAYVARALADTVLDMSRLPAGGYTLSTDRTDPVEDPRLVGCWLET